jgi:xanthine/CO dehydrogenase XdhC/CoxF family maturation factor
MAWCWARSPAPGARRRGPPGSVVAVRDDGQIAGSVSGGCIEDDLIDKARQGAGRRRACPGRALRHRAPNRRPLRPALRRELIELVLEPWARTAGSTSCWPAGAGERVRRVLTLASGAVTWARPTGRRAAAGRHHAGHHPRPALAAAVDRGRRPDDAVPGADGAGAGLPGHRVRPARRIRHAFDRARRAAHVRTMPDDAVQALKPDGAHGGDRADARPQARRPGADGGAALAGVLRRRHRLARQPGQAQAAPGRALRHHRVPTGCSTACMARWAEERRPHAAGDRACRASWPS